MITWKVEWMNEITKFGSKMSNQSGIVFLTAAAHVWTEPNKH